MIKPKTEAPKPKDEPEEEHPKPKHHIPLHTLLYQVTVVTLLVMIVVAQFAQIYYLRTMPGNGTASDANGPLAVEVVNRALRVEVENPSGELGSHPLLVEVSPYAAPVKVEVTPPQQPAGH